MPDKQMTRMREYVCVDLETTGLNPKTDRIIEIGAVKMRDGIAVETFSELVNPGRKLSEHITELTGLTDEDLREAATIDEVLPRFLAFAKDLPLLGHSVLFDFSFLKKACVDRKLSYERAAVDTLKIARKYLPELPSRSLGALCTYYEIPHTAHRALGDAEATATLYGILSERFDDGEEKLFSPEPQSYKVKRDQPIRPEQKERLEKLVQQYHLTLEAETGSLSRSEASRLIDKIYNKYGRIG